MSPLLSVLVPSVPSRLPFFFPRLMKQLLVQVGDSKKVEIVGLFDNKIRSVGEKRNALLDLANGKFLTFIDDDDRVADDYITTLLDTIQKTPDADCIVFDSITCINGGPPIQCKYGIEFDYGYINGGKAWRGKPAHTMVWNSSIAKSKRFQDRSHGEDFPWVALVWPLVRKQIRIDKVLYFYDANYKTTSETAPGTNAATVAKHSGLEEFLK